MTKQSHGESDVPAIAFPDLHRGRKDGLASILVAIRHATAQLTPLDNENGTTGLRQQSVFPAKAGNQAEAGGHMGPPLRGGAGLFSGEGKPMPFVLFHDYFPEVAERETRTITVLENSGWALPPAQYSVLEMYCDEPGCDCRRVFFCIVSSLTKRAETVIAYGWESPDFYAKWIGDDDPEVISDLKGPILNHFSTHSDLAPALLNVVRDVVLQDEAYIQRLKTHYWMFRHHFDTKPKRKAKSGA